MTTELYQSPQLPYVGGKGFDFAQEEDLKGVLKYLPKGTLFEYKSFKRAVNTKQHFEDNIKRDLSPQLNRPHDKYICEVPIV